MNIKKLSKAIQEYIKDELTYIVIYKQGRSWNYDFLYESDQDDYTQDEDYIKAYSADNKAIIVNGYYDNFGDCTLLEIEYRIKYNYSKSIGNFKPTIQLQENKTTSENTNIYRTKETMGYFNNIVESIKQKLNVNIPIIISNHEKLEDKKAKEALGIAWKKYDNEPVYLITIDEYFVYECYMDYLWNNGNRKDGLPKVEIKSIEEVICHEIAHIKHWNHTKRHKALTQQYINYISA